MIIPKNNLKQKKELIVIFCIIVVCFLLLQPKISSLLFPIKQQYMLNTFVNSVKQDKTLNLQKYWEFREFYSPGSFVYEKNGLVTKQNAAINEFVALDKKATPQLLFSSAKVVSVGGRTKNNTLPMINTWQHNIILHTSSELLLENNGSLSLYFLKPISEVAKANGFLQNQPFADPKGTLWFEVTTIKN
jgi:hypothetical protein